ncbi:hypothetical protein ATY81_12385 [Rhizobium sp. R72]|uniref:hypothetical protein n=1 Tax=unclassified Rhizobium TaxID=2613769 RepID=UPI000B531718|nr:MULTISPECIES: hypothetical protein [unclassified Rhizobium]OWV94243.1 hypothetical protein ATY81_12385 [Rhizobium sp. R72]OWV94513.1 hypothetical protein ATY80_12385 [Rhizobium sp. R711]
MQTQTYPAAIARNIANEMADLALERREGLTRKDFRDLGYTDEQIDAYSQKAAHIHSRRAVRRVA